MPVDSDDLPPAVRVWNLVDARTAASCACELKRPLLLLCPQESATFGGIAWFKGLLENARADFDVELPSGVEVGDDGALAHEALQARLDVVIFTGPASLTERLKTIAEAQGAVLLERVPEALDLASASQPRDACRLHLAR